MSSRHAYAIYKISARDGSILWRLGGKKSDFRMDANTHFSAQHDARCLSQNETHMVISLMDNAVGIYEGYITNSNSRGLILSVNTEAMTATEIMHYDHPYGVGGYADGRGNVQILPNGNAFVSWKDNCLHSEYSADGQLIAEAEFPAGLKTYRSFKFPWVGHALAKPDVYSHVIIDENQDLKTAVHVSWNGDTQAGEWRLYKTDSEGTTAELLNTTRRNGFETVITYEGYVPFVKVDAENWGGANLTRSVSDPIQTIFQRDAGGDESGPEISEDKYFQIMFTYAVVAFPGGIVLGVLLCCGIWRLWSRGSLLPRRRKDPYPAWSRSNEKAGLSETDRLLREDGQITDASERASRERYDSD